MQATLPPESSFGDRFRRAKKHPMTPVAFFFAGFIFDAFLLHRPDTLLQIAHQALYLFILTLLLAATTLEDHGLLRVPEKLKKYWKYHEHLTQFLLGTLLNVYTFFFFKSGSLLSSLAFIVIIAGLLVANEFVRLKRHQLILKLVLYFLCLNCFWLYIIPMVMGFVGLLAFILSLVVSNGFIWILYGYVGQTLEKKHTPPMIQRSILRKILGAGYGVAIAFVLFYSLSLIPPVPLSLQYIGIFHAIRKEGDAYVLSYTRPNWKFWQNGDQNFEARPGDNVIAFIRVFAPRGFQDQLFVRWSLKTKRGWEKQDAIPITVNGGRDQGFRGYTSKANYQPGDYRVQVETTDGREVGRIGLKITEDVSTSDRTLQEVRH